MAPRPSDLSTSPAGVSGLGPEQVSQSAPVAAALGQIATPVSEGAPVLVRRGLPRAPQGEPWPPADTAPRAPGPAGQVAHSAGSVAGVGQVATPTVDAADSAPGQVAQSAPMAATPGRIATPVSDGAPALVRRGLPRAAQGEPWPPADTALRAPGSAGQVAQSVGSAAQGGQVVAPTVDAADSAPGQVAQSAPTAAATGQIATPVAGPAAAPSAPAPVAHAPASTEPRAPLTVPRTVWAGRAAYHRAAPKPEPQKLGPFTKAQWAGAVILGGGGLLFAAALAVVFVRAFLSLEFMQDFLATYPGEYHLPEGAPVGFPAWLGWQHFFNVFLMVLIIRSGLTIRTEKRPSVFWTPRGNPKGKTSLTIWFHQALDILWLANGLVFIVLLFVTGQWMRIIPTSWEVIPNAVSAALQYVSLDWPTENGWVNYNALQQIAYFSTVFVAAPLAAVTGYRMSGMWPKGNAKLNAAYPIEWARKVHFPVMLYFVVFIFIHVALVLATGALRNLNHMYAAQGSADGVAYADNWTGFWMFALSLVVIAAAWVAARPLVLAPIARLFGTVSGR